MKKTLLVPTDFSNNSLSAAKYASRLAIERDYAVHLIHYYTVDSSSFATEELSKEFENSEVLKADLTIVEFERKLQEEFPTVRYTHRTSRGFLPDTLPQEAKKPEYEAIVMGTKGHSDKKSVRWGSNTSAVAAKSTIPLLIIPNYYSQFKIQKIGLLTNFKTDELTTLREFIDTFGPVSQLELIHVYNKDEVEATVHQKLDDWSQKINQSTSIDKINHCIDSLQSENKEMDTVAEVIHNLVESNNIDIVLITKTRKSFFERLFNPSVSKAVVLDINKPSYFSKV